MKDNLYHAQSDSTYHTDSKFPKNQRLSVKTTTDRENRSRTRFQKTLLAPPISFFSLTWNVTRKGEKTLRPNAGLFQIRERLNGRPKLKFASTVAQPMLYQSEFRNHCNKLNTHTNSKNSIRHSLVKHGDLCHVSSTCLALIDSLANFSVHLGRLLCFAFFFLFFFESGTLPNASKQTKERIVNFLCLRPWFKNN